MSQYEARLERDLSHIRGQLASLAEAVQTALETASLALFASDHELAYGVCLADHPINRASRELDKICHGFIAVHLPSAGHLRFVSAVMRLNLELERIGDYAVTISRETAQLQAPPADPAGGQLQQVAHEARRLLALAVSAFDDGDADAARAGTKSALVARRHVGACFAAVVKDEKSAPARELLFRVVILNCYDRVVDQSKNICEETIFAVTGETKAPKSYRVLFLDRDNSILGPMAQAIATKHHAQSGQYSSAGQQPADTFRQGLGVFLAERGFELAATTRQLDPTADLGDYHVIVSLQGSVRDHIGNVPYSTIALDWNLDAALSAESNESSQLFESVYRSLAPQIRDLMMTVHGEEQS